MEGRYIENKTKQNEANLLTDTDPSRETKLSDPQTISNLELQVMLNQKRPLDGSFFQLL